MKNMQLSKEGILSLIKRYHFVIFTVVVTIVLSVSVLLLYSIVYKASGEDSIPQNSISTSFDQATIDEIDQLKTSSEPSEPLDFSEGRINPFSE